MNIGQNIGIHRQNNSYQLNIGQNENICIGIGCRYVGANISVFAKILAGRIYWYRLDPYRYRSNPKAFPVLLTFNFNWYIAVHLPK
jgi:hypothetical protein